MFNTGYGKSKMETSKPELLIAPFVDKMEQNTSSYSIFEVPKFNDIIVNTARCNWKRNPEWRHINLKHQSPYTVQNPHRSTPIVLLDPKKLGISLITYTVAEL